MSGSGRESLPEVWERAKDFPDVREWCEALTYVRESSGDLPGCPRLVVRPSWMSGNGRETLPNVLEWWEALQDVREWSGGHLGWPVVIGRPS